MDGDTTLTDRVIRCAIEVHKSLGPGTSGICLRVSAVHRIQERTQFLSSGRSGIPLYYRGELISEHRPDLIVDDRVIVEIKSVERLAPIHMAQMLTYLRVTSLRVGLILNFNSDVRTDPTGGLNAKTHG